MISDLSVKELFVCEIPNVGNRILALAGGVGRSTGDGGYDPAHRDPRHPLVGVGVFYEKEGWFVSMERGGAVRKNDRGNARGLYTTGALTPKLLVKDPNIDLSPVHLVSSSSSTFRAVHSTLWTTPRETAEGRSLTGALHRRENQRYSAATLLQVDDPMIMM